MHLYATPNTLRKLRALASWRGESMARVVADLIAHAYLTALVERAVPRPTAPSPTAPSPAVTSSKGDGR